MSYLEIFITFVVIWWLAIFLVLPFGNKWDEEEETASGLAQSSPKIANLKMKAKVTTGISIILTIVAYFIMES